MSLGADLFAGTAWTFASPHFDGQLDYLFIDEAGQVATANVVAMATATKNIILVGDQMQLGQPIQGTHPGEAGLSVLEFLLGDHSTIPAERGIFLGQTRRMRPSICQFISDAFYDGRLTAHESTAERSLDLQGIDLPNEGIVMISAEHEGCSQKSVEEGEIIKAKYDALLGQEFTDRDGTTRPITEDDILVVRSINLSDFINQQIKRSEGTWTRLIYNGDQDMLAYAKSEIVQDFLQRIDSDTFAKIVYRIAQNPNENRSGVSDFIIWNDDELRMVEVKKVREQVRESQLNWLSWMIDENIPVEIVRVKAV
ncbi:MAG: hypothetical protein CL570_03605 [Alphaproteobacteria bacterium]|nr:hypothetical protein [Alphaproteobacteria bacterium]